MDNILLIDGMNAMWRASVSFSPKKKENIEEEISDEFVLIYNFFRNLRPIIELFEPNKCFFVLEGYPKFRHDIYAGYKANRIIKQASRQKAQEKVFHAKDDIVKLLQLLPITICRAADYECDDTIATLCENMRDESLTVLSNDSDYIQLLQRGYKDCNIYNPIKKSFMAAPSYPYVAWKCLNGDESDNIPPLLKPQKALETISTPEKFRQFLCLEENRANFSINRQLIEFRKVPEEEIEITEGIKNFGLLKEEFIRMKFKSIVNDKSWTKYTKTFGCLKY